MFCALVELGLCLVVGWWFHLESTYKVLNTGEREREEGSCVCVLVDRRHTRKQEVMVCLSRCPHVRASCSMHDLSQFSCLFCIILAYRLSAVVPCFACLPRCRKRALILFGSHSDVMWFHGWPDFGWRCDNNRVTITHTHSHTHTLDIPPFLPSSCVCVMNSSSV